MANGVVDPSFYADFGALTTLGRQAKQNDPQAIREAARQFESLFTDMMLKSMRAAKLGDDLGESQEGDFYQDMYDQQLAVQMSQGHGLGLADLLVRQLTRAGAGGTSGANAPATDGAGTAASDTSSTAASSTAASSTAASRAAASGTAASSPGKTTTVPTGPPGANQGAASLGQRIGFVQQLAPYAQRASAALGVSVDTLIAQAALETGWGRHVVSGAARASSHNLFGVKAGGRWGGDTAAAVTTEYSSGSAHRVRQAFRSYASVQQGVSDYVSLLQHRGSYSGAIGSGSDARAFAGALQRGGYATDPNYVQKLVATTDAVRSVRSLLAATGTTAAAPMVTMVSSAAPSDAAAAASAGAARAGSDAFKLLAGMPIQADEQPA